MLLAAVMLQASIAAPAFAPPLGTPLRIVTERIETSPAERRYRLERLVRFSKESTGYRAEAVLLANASAAPEALGNLVERGLSALAGRIIVLHLDERGEVTTVDEMAVLWERVCQRIAEAAATRPGLASDAASAKLVGPLRALPPERQRTLLATLVTAAIMTDPREPPGSFTPVRLPGASPLGTPVTLEGMRRTTTAGNGLIQASTTASAKVELPAQAGALARTGSVSLDRQRAFDPRTGMLSAATDTVRNVSGTGPTARETLLVTRIRIEHADSAAWPD